MTKLWTIIRHNQGLTIGISIAVGVLIWTYGCQSTVISVMSPPQMVTRGQLQIEVDTFLATAKLRFENLDRQDEIKSILFDYAIGYATEGHINPIGVAVTLGNIMGIGAIVDNRRKDVHIKTLKAKPEKA